MTFEFDTLGRLGAKNDGGDFTSPNESPRSHDDEVKHSLGQIDWSFSDRKSHTPLEALHPYPAKFILEIPRALLETLPLPHGSAVLDPFCGSGTTLAECQSMGIDSVGIDLNPIACLIASVRTSTLPSGFGEAAKNVSNIAQKSGECEIPDIPRLDHWFNPESQRALAGLKFAISEFENGPLKDVLELTFSSIIVRVSNQESDTRYAAIDKGTSFEGVISTFDKAAQRIANALPNSFKKKCEVQVIEADTLAVRAEDISKKIGMVITSPPYPNAYEYWLYHKYRMWWLEKDPLAVKEREIGARAHFFKKNHHTADDFARQMGATLDLIAGVIIDEGFACFIIGRSKIHGRIYDNAAMIKQEGEKRGFYPFFEVERPIASTRKSFNLSHANIRKETVLVLRKGC